MKTRPFSMLALTASVFAAAGSITASSAELDFSTLPKVSQLPKDVVQVSPSSQTSQRIMLTRKRRPSDPSTA